MRNREILHIYAKYIIILYKAVINQWIDKKHKLIVKMWIKVLKLNQ